MAKAEWRASSLCPGVTWRKGCIQKSLKACEGPKVRIRGTAVLKQRQGLCSWILVRLPSCPGVLAPPLALQPATPGLPVRGAFSPPHTAFGCEVLPRTPASRPALPSGASPRA